MKNNQYHFKIECVFKDDGLKIEDIIENHLLLYLKEFATKSLIN